MIGEVSCCDAWIAERTHCWIERWLELCFLELLQRSHQPQLLDVVWSSVCNGNVVVVVVSVVVVVAAAVAVVHVVASIVVVMLQL